MADLHSARAGLVRRREEEVQIMLGGGGKGCKVGRGKGGMVVEEGLRSRGRRHRLGERILILRSEKTLW